MTRPDDTYDPRKYLEYRLFWPNSSGMPGQWMSHQIDTVHWFSGLPHPRSAVANGGVYYWKDGRKNWDTMTVVYEYGPLDDLSKGFQVVFQSRMHNGIERPSEIYYSNGGELNLITNKISPTGGLEEGHAKAMNLKANLLPEMDIKAAEEKVVASANTGGCGSRNAFHPSHTFRCGSLNSPEADESCPQQTRIGAFYRFT
jgi:hypothetical protein